MFEDDGRDRLAEEWSDFNQSLLFFLPKKATGTTASGEGIYEPENVRPLNVTTAENRILAPFHEVGYRTSGRSSCDMDSERVYQREIDDRKFSGYCGGYGCRNLQLG